MSLTSIQKLNELGQSIWLDNISRGMIESGKLKQMIDLGLCGMTSNPSIFDKAVSSGADYDQKILKLQAKSCSVFEIYDELTIGDVQDAADIFLPVYKNSQGLDGYVSLEINPELAYQTEATIKEGKRLHEKVNRPNVMFKVPSTKQGFGAIEELTASGININVTLIFALSQYIDTAQAYLRGIKRFLQNKNAAGSVRSVASIFASRIDTLTDKLIDNKKANEQDPDKIRRFNALYGRAAVANCQLIYKKHLELFSTPEFKQLHERGVNFQRVLWGSTGTKNPAYSDIKYVTELIGKNTINTLPEPTLQAFLDHGQAKEALSADSSGAQRVIDELMSLGVDMEQVCAQLLEEGVEAFAKSFRSLLHSIQVKQKPSGSNIATKGGQN